MVDQTGKNNGETPDWEDLQHVWQDTPPIDMGKLARNARFVWWRMRINFALEVIFCLAGLVIFGSFIDKSSHSATAFGLVGVIFSAAGFWAAVHIRRGVWEEAAGDAAGLVRFQIKRAQSELLYVRVNCWLGYASLVLMALALWFFYDRIETVTPTRVTAFKWVLGVVLSVVILFPIVTRPFVRRKKILIEQLQQVELQLQDDKAAEL